MDATFIQRVDHPTRDVLVTRTLDGDREFAGFGQDTNTYADCFLDPEKIPDDAVRASNACVTGTLGLAYPQSRDAITKVVDDAKNSSNCTLIIDVNWRPVFWDDISEAHKIISEFVQDADIVKITDDEAEWLLHIPRNEALENPGKVLSKFENAKGVLVSAGENGSSYAFRAPGGKMDLSGTVPVLSVEIADTTGAGDAYLSGFIYFMLKSGGIDSLIADAGLLHKAVRFATACGAATCMNPGAIDSQPTLEQVENLLK